MLSGSDLAVDKKVSEPSCLPRGLVFLKPSLLRCVPKVVLRIVASSVQRFVRRSFVPSPWVAFASSLQALSLTRKVLIDPSCLPPGLAFFEGRWGLTQSTPPRGIPFEKTQGFQHTRVDFYEALTPVAPPRFESRGGVGDGVNPP